MNSSNDEARDAQWEKLLEGKLSAKKGSAPASPTTPEPSSSALSATDEWYQESVPDAIYELPDVVETSDREVEANVEKIQNDIAIAVRKYGKGDDPIPVSRKPGEFDIRCPIPEHPDNAPSAGYNTEKKTWFCFPCDKGGDAITLAGIHHRMDPTGDELPALKRKMVSDFTGWEVEEYGNYEIVKSPAVEEILQLEKEKEESESRAALDEMFAETMDEAPSKYAKPTPLPTRAKPAPAPPTDGTAARDASESSTVTRLHRAKPVEETKEDTKHLEDVSNQGLNIKVDMTAAPGLPKLDFYSLMPEGTFLRTYFDDAIPDEFAKEYHFFNGLVGLSVLGGTRIQCQRFKYQSPNVFVCTVGATSTGKTASAAYIQEVIQEVIPFSPQDVNRNGVKFIRGIASGESLIDAFADKVEENNTVKVDGHVKGLLVEDEMRALSSKAGRDGSILQDILNQMYSGGPVGTVSRGKGSVLAKDIFLSVVTNVQPKILNKALSKSDSASGFLNRFFFVFPHHNERQWGADRPLFNPANSIEKAKEIKDWLDYDIPVDYDNPGLHMKYITMDEHALSTLADFYHKEFMPLLPQNPEGDDIFGRAGAAMEKLVLLFAINERTDVVGIDIARRVMHVMSYLRKTWFMTNSHMAVNEIDESDEYVQERYIAYYKSCHKQGKTPAGLTAAKLYNRAKITKYSKEEVAQSCQRLERQGFLIKERDLKKGSKSTGYLINPEMIEKDD